MHNRCDLRRVGIRFQPEFIFTLVDLLRIVAVDAVRRVPVGVLLGETADIGVIIPRAEVVGLRLAVVVFAAVAERIAIQRVRLLFHAERIVIILMRDRAGIADQLGDVAMRVEQIVGFLASVRTRDQVCAAQVCDRFASDMLADHIPAVEQEMCLARGCRFTCADALCIVGIRRDQTVFRCGRKLIEQVIGIGRTCQASIPAVERLRQKIAVRVVGICRQISQQAACFPL